MFVDASLDLFMKRIGPRVRFFGVLLMNDAPSIMGDRVFRKAIAQLNERSGPSFNIFLPGFFKDEDSQELIRNVLRSDDFMRFGKNLNWHEDLFKQAKKDILARFDYRLPGDSLVIFETGPRRICDIVIIDDERKFKEAIDKALHYARQNRV